MQAMAEPTITTPPKLTSLLPAELLSTFNRQVVDTIMGLWCSPPAGTQIDFSGDAYKESKAVMRAALAGHCTYEEAAAEMTDRLWDAADSLTAQKLTGMLAQLKTMSASASAAVTQQGRCVLTFIWAKLGGYMESQFSGGTVRLSSLDPKASVSSELSAKVRRPKSKDEFYEMLHYFQAVVHTIGIAALMVVSPFVTNVVFHTINRLKESWHVAHELLLIYFRAIEFDTTRQLNLGNVYVRGSGDTYLAEARLNSQCFFCEEEPRSSVVTWNGKFNSSHTAKPCVAYNLDADHKEISMDRSGCCKYNHICMQWVSDKGPGGMCGGAHPKSKCTYDASKKLNQPLP